jgi:hypothetical protein
VAHSYGPGQHRSRVAVGLVRRRASRGPYAAGRPGSRGPRAYASVGENHGYGCDAGCSAGTCACSREGPTISMTWCTDLLRRQVSEPGQITPDAVAQRPSNGTGPRQTGQTALLRAARASRSEPAYFVVARKPRPKRSLRSRRASLPPSQHGGARLPTLTAGRPTLAAGRRCRPRRPRGAGWRLSTVAGVQTSRHADIGRTYRGIACVEGKRLLTSRPPGFCSRSSSEHFQVPSPSTERLGLSHPHDSYTSCG